MNKKVFLRKRIKASAHIHMSGNWLTALLVAIIGIVILSFIISFLPLRRPGVEEVLAQAGDSVAILKLLLPETITKRTVASFIVTGVLGMLVMTPFRIGVKRFFLKVARGEKAKFMDVFSVYADLSLVFSSVILSIILILLFSFWTVIFSIIPYGVMVLGLYLKSYVILQIAAILSIASSVFTIFWMSRYTFASFILSRGENGGAFSSLRTGLRLIKGRCGELLRLRASYIIWDIVNVLSAFSLPLMFIYTSLYQTVWAKYLLYFESGEN